MLNSVLLCAEYEWPSLHSNCSHGWSTYFTSKNVAERAMVCHQFEWLAIQISTDTKH